jgi:Flp pilus assembly protein TadG
MKPYLLALFRRLNDFLDCRAGHIAMMAAIIAPVFIGLAGAAVDFNSLMTHKTNLQDIADAAALASAKEASLNGWSKKAALAIVDGFLEAHRNSGVEGTVSAEVNVDSVRRQITVTLAQDNRPYFIASYFVGSPQIVVSSTARTNNSSNICVIGLDESDDATVSLETNAVISAPKCAVYSNSDSTSGLVATGNSNLIAQLTCTAGGYGGMPKNYDQELPLTDCPIVSDPLASRPAPSVGPCKEKDAAYSHYIGSLQPGVYCGGLTIKASSEVTLKPGVYVIKDGPLVIESSSTVEANGVGFYFTGSNASFLFESSSQVDIEAPISGPLAGLVAFQDRSSPETDFVITSNKARKLLGTIYLSNGNLIVAANNKVADGSAYTAIVVRRLRLSKGPNLVLNTNYDQTLVPVPEGVGPQTIAPQLIN